MIRTGFLLVALLAAGAVVLAVSALPVAWQGETVRAGAAFVFQGSDRWLALLGLGLSLGTQARRRAGIAWAAFVVGAALGLVAPRSGLWPWITSPPIFPFRHLLDPAACLLASLVLLAGGRWRSRILPPAACAAMAALSLTAAINDPALGGSAFAAGAALASLAVTLLVAILRPLAPDHGASIAERIAGSWLLAIGLLLGAVRLAPAPAPIIELVPPVPKPAWSVPDVPGYAPPSRPDAARFPGSPGSPMGTN